MIGRKRDRIIVPKPVDLPSLQAEESWLEMEEQTYSVPIFKAGVDGVSVENRVWKIHPTVSPPSLMAQLQSQPPQPSQRIDRVEHRVEHRIDRVDHKEPVQVARMTGRDPGYKERWRQDDSDLQERDPARHLPSGWPGTQPSTPRTLWQPPNEPEGARKPRHPVGRHSDRHSDTSFPLKDNRVPLKDNRVPLKDNRILSKDQRAGKPKDNQAPLKDQKASKPKVKKEKDMKKKEEFVEEKEVIILDQVHAEEDEDDKPKEKPKKNGKKSRTFASRDSVVSGDVKNHEAKNADLDTEESLSNSVSQDPAVVSKDSIVISKDPSVVSKDSNKPLKSKWKLIKVDTTELPIMPKADALPEKPKEDLPVQPKVDGLPVEPKVDTIKSKADGLPNKPKVDLPMKPKVDGLPLKPKVDLPSKPKVEDRTSHNWRVQKDEKVLEELPLKPKPQTPKRADKEVFDQVISSIKKMMSSKSMGESSSSNQTDEKIRSKSQDVEFSVAIPDSVKNKAIKINFFAGSQKESIPVQSFIPNLLETTPMPLPTPSMNPVEKEMEPIFSAPVWAAPWSAAEDNPFNLNRNTHIRSLWSNGSPETKEELSEDHFEPFVPPQEHQGNRMLHPQDQGNRMLHPQDQGNRMLHLQDQGNRMLPPQDQGNRMYNMPMMPMQWTPEMAQMNNDFRPVIMPPAEFMQQQQWPAGFVPNMMQKMVPFQPFGHMPGYFPMVPRYDMRPMMYPMPVQIPINQEPAPVQRVPVTSEKRVGGLAGHSRPPKKFVSQLIKHEL